MSNKSSKSPSGEEREHNPHIRQGGVEKEDVAGHSGKGTGSGSDRNKEQENLQNRGIQEDQPKNPVRSTGSTGKEQENLPTGEPDGKENPLDKGNLTGPGLG